jgi:hypothetical protein
LALGDPHRQWWQSFLKDSGGTGFWHETYFRRGGIEAIDDDIPENIGHGVCARGPGSRSDVWRSIEGRKTSAERPVLSEEVLYGKPET